MRHSTDGARDSSRKVAGSTVARNTLTGVIIATLTAKASAALVTAHVAYSYRCVIFKMSYENVVSNFILQGTFRLNDTKTFLFYSQ